MAIKIAQTKPGTSTLASTVITWNNNTVSGNTIVVAVATNITTDVSTITDSQSNSYVKAFAAAGTGIGAELWYAKNILGGTTPTVTVNYTTGATAAVVIQEYSGIDTVTVLDQTNTGVGNSNSLDSGTAVRSSQPLELLVGVGGLLSGTFTAGGSFVNLTQQANTTVNVAIEDLMVTSQGAYNATFSASGSNQWACGIAAFRAGPQGTTTSTSSTSVSSTSTSISSTSSSTSSTSISTTSKSTSTSSTSSSTSITTISTSSTSSSVSSTSISSTSSSTSISSTSSSVSSTSVSSTSTSSTSSSTSISSTSSSVSSTSSSISSTSSSVSSTSFSSTSSSRSTSTTTLPPPFQTFSYEDRAVYTQTLIFPSSANWVCPPNVSTVQAECWGAGGGGGGGNAGANVNGGGGGGGAYTLGTASVTPGTSYTINVGAAGSAGGAGGGNGTAGGDTYFKDTSTILAKGGGAGLAGSPGNGGAGGSSASGVGTTLHSGGTGGNGNNAGTNQGGGGGGSAGNASDGGNGTNTGTAGTAGTGTIANGTAGGAGGSTNPGLAPTQTPGGGGGGGGANSAGAAGQGGFLRLTYTSTTPPPTSNTNLINAFNAVQYGNVSTDDGDYFIEYGSEFVMQEYKFKNPRGNNTDNITFTWRGRSTEDPRVSPILMQIYNTNSAAWETLATINTVPPDTDFSTTVTQSTNLANYYDSTNTVAFRSYQLVF